jgi:hypothetical protein
MQAVRFLSCVIAVMTTTTAAALDVWDLGSDFDPTTLTARNGPWDYRNGPQPPSTDPDLFTTPADLVPHTNVFNSGASGFANADASAALGGSGGFPVPMIMDNSAAEIAGLTERIASHSYITIAWTAPRTTFIDIVGHMTELAGMRGLYWHFDLNGEELSHGVVASNQLPHQFAHGSRGYGGLRSIPVQAGDRLYLTVQDVTFSQVGVREDLFGLEYTITEVPDPASRQTWNLADYFDPNTPTAVNGPFDYRRGPQPPGSDPAQFTTPADLVSHSDLFNTPGDGFASEPGTGGFPTPMIMDNSAAQIAGLAESVAAHSYITIAWTAPKTTHVDIVGHITELAGERGLFWRFNLDGQALSSGVVESNQLPHDFMDGSGGASALKSIAVDAGDQVFLTVQDVVLSQVGMREDLFGLDLAFVEVTPPAGIPGDYNEDTRVDAADYVMWRNNLGSSTTLPNDDTAGVDQDDYNRWRANFGAGATVGSAITVLVPEPFSLTLVVLGAAAITATSLHRKRLIASCSASCYGLRFPALLSSAKTTSSVSGGTLHFSGVFAASRYIRGSTLGVYGTMEDRSRSTIR